MNKKGQFLVGPFPFKNYKFNGKPVEHWDNMAKELVIYLLVKAATDCDQRSLPGFLASRELLGMALSKNRFLVQKVLDERDQWQENLAEFLKHLLPDKKVYNEWKEKRANPKSKKRKKRKK